MNPFESAPKLRRFIGKTPKQLIHILRPGAEIEAVAGMLSGLDLDIGVQVPAWAKASSKKFCDEFGISLPAGFDQNEPEAIGKLVGLFEAALHGKSSAFEDAIREFCQNAKTEAANAPAENAKAFFDARVEGAKLPATFVGISQRTKIYLLTACAWQVVQTFKSTGEFHRFLFCVKRDNGQPAFAPSTDSREVRKICESIGLKFQNKWRKQKTEIPAKLKDARAGI